MVKIKFAFLLLSIHLFLFAFQVRDAKADFYSYRDSGGVMHFTNVPTSDNFRWYMREAGTIKRVYTSAYASAHNSYDELIKNMSRIYRVEEGLVRAVIKVESDFNPRAVSHKGAVGLMQLMPGTAQLMGVKDLYDPTENIRGGVRYLSYLLGKFEQNLPLALAAYNAGENAVLKYGSIPPFDETRLYVRKVMNYHKSYTGTGQAR